MFEVYLAKSLRRNDSEQVPESKTSGVWSAMTFFSLSEFKQCAVR